MKYKQKNMPDKEDYHFIKETIKDKPPNKKKVFHRIAAIAGSGLLFGCMAAVAWMGTITLGTKYISGIEQDREEINITKSLPEMVQLPAAEEAETEQFPAAIESETQQETETEAAQTEENGSFLEKYDAIFKEVLSISEAPRKALVTVKGITEDENLLDDSYLSKGKVEGILFLETEEDFYFLFYGESLKDSKQLKVIFQDNSVALAKRYRIDEETGIAVAVVDKKTVGDSTESLLQTAKLDPGKKHMQTEMVIAIGSPSGERDAVSYGRVTSVGGSLSVSDMEYTILETDIHGSTDGTGFLLDTEGCVIGVMITRKEFDSCTVHALETIQIRSLVESLMNGKSVRYTGLRGITITENVAQARNIPQGVYVDGVENDSPAMTAGILVGDIITEIEEEDISDMEDYSNCIQSMNAGDHIKVTIMRKGAENQYVEMKFEVVVQEH